jgi:phage replication O-like protein O
MDVTRIENGYTRVENEILESISKINLSPYESRVLHYLWRKTYGWQKNMDRIALAQFAEDIGIDRRLVSRTLRKLESRRLIEIQNHGRWRRAYGFQKDPAKWRNSKRK